MKKTILLPVALTLLVLLLLSACSKTEKTRLPIPEDAFVYMTWTNLEGDWNRTMQTEFVRKMQSLGLWENPKIQAAILDEFDNTLKGLERKIGASLNKENFMTLFGKKVDFALVPGDPYPGMLLAMDLGSKSTAMKVMDRFKTRSKDFPFDVIEYKDRRITRLPLGKSGFEAAYFFDGARVVLTNGLKIAESGIDLLDSGEKTILDNRKLQALRKDLGDYENLLYMDVVEIEKMLSDLMKASDENDRQVLAGYYAHYDSGVMGWKWQGRTWHVTSIGRFRNDPASRNLSKLFRRGRIAQDSSRWIPRDPLFAFYGSPDWKEIFHYRKQSIRQSVGDSAWHRITTEFGALLGTNLDREIEDWAGSGVFFTLQNLHVQGMFPVPETILGIGISNEKKMRAFMQRVERSLPGKPFATRKIEGTEFRSISLQLPPGGRLPKGVDWAPGYAITNNYLVVALSPAGFTESLKAYDGDRDSILKTKAFRKLRTGDTERAVFVQYVDIASIMDALASWVDRHRMFCPPDLNPDDVTEGIKTLGLISAAVAETYPMDNGDRNELTIEIR